MSSGPEPPDAEVETKALPLLVVTSSLLDLVIRPTTSSIDITSVYVVEEALASFLAVNLEDRFNGDNKSVLLEEVDVVVRALRFDIRRELQMTGSVLNNTLNSSSAPSVAPTAIPRDSVIDDANDEGGYQPSTILTTSVSAKFRGHPGDVSYHPHHLDKLIYASFRDAKEGSSLHDFLKSSSDHILRSVTDTEIGPTTYAAFAAGAASFAPTLTKTGAAVIDGNDISTGMIQPTGNTPPPPSITNTAFRNDPMDVIFVAMSGLIFFAMVVMIYVHRSSRGPSHDERVRRFFAPGADRTGNSVSIHNTGSDENPINEANFASEGSGMADGIDRAEYRTGTFSSLPSASVPTLSKYHYPIPILQPRRSSSSSSHALLPVLGAADNGLITIPEDETFVSPSYFDPSNLHRVDSNISEDVFGVDIEGRERTALGEEVSYDDNISSTTAQSGGSSTLSRWEGWLQQVMVVNAGGDADDENEDVGDEDDESSDNSHDKGDECTKKDPGYSC